MTDRSDTVPWLEDVEPQLTKREYFAAQAMNGLLRGAANRQNPEDVIQGLVSLAYIVADEMLIQGEDDL